MDPMPINSGIDHQSFLAAAIHSRNIHRFRLALLLNDVSPDQPIGDEGVDISIFEQCCQTPGYHEFVRECIRWGCDIHKVNPSTEKSALNYAVDSGDVENIRAVLENPSSRSDSRKINAADSNRNNDAFTDAEREALERRSSATISTSHTTTTSSCSTGSNTTLDIETVSSVGITTSPLAQLANNLNSDNFEELFQCIRELISRRAANVNTIDHATKSPPLLIIAKSPNIASEQKERLVQYILENSRCDLDSFGGGETRFFLNAQFPHLHLPDRRHSTVDSRRHVWDFAELMDVLVAGRESDFLRGLKALLKQTSRAGDTDGVQRLFSDRFYNETLLMVAARKGLTRAAEKLLEYGADVNGGEETQITVGDDDLLDDNDVVGRRLPVELACIYGNWEVLELFLRRPNLKLGDAPLLVNVVRKIGEPTMAKGCDYRRCFYLLLNGGRVDVNQTDASGCTALHAAVRYNNQPEILALLARGAYIGSPNKYNDLPITDIDAKVLETHFNTCISTNGRRPGDDNYEIRFDYTNLVPLIVRKIAPRPSLTSSGRVMVGSARNRNGSVNVEASITEVTTTSNGSRNSYEDPMSYFARAAIPQCTDEMAPIEYMARSADLKHLVKHPLIASFLFLKWHQLALVFYANFICYTVYCLALIMYVLCCYGRKTDAGRVADVEGGNTDDGSLANGSGAAGTNAGLAALLYIVSCLGTLYVLAREIAQLVMSPKVYARNKENYLELVLITTTVIVLTNWDFTESTRKTVAAFTILLAVSEFFLLTGSLPVLSFSTHLVMLKTVAKSFLKGLLLYSIILVAFALCFYTLLGDSVGGDAATASSGVVVSDDIADFNNFVHPGVAIVKAVVMLTGEFDASNVHFKQNYASYVLFVVFVLLISTVLSNLLNGLAVSDTQAIKSEAELMNFIYRAELMARYEKILLGKGENMCCNFLLRKWSSSMMNVFPEFLPLNMLTVLPNANNQVVIPVTPADPHAIRRMSSYHSSPQQHFNHHHHVLLEDGSIKYRQLEGTVRALNCCFGIRCSSMEVKIVKYAKYVLDLKDRDLKEQKERELMQQRIVNIEKRMEEMFAEVLRQGRPDNAKDTEEAEDTLAV